MYGLGSNNYADKICKFGFRQDGQKSFSNGDGFVVKLKTFSGDTKRFHRWTIERYGSELFVAQNFNELLLELEVLESYKNGGKQ